MTSAAIDSLKDQIPFHIGASGTWVNRCELPTDALRKPHDAPLYFLHLSYQDRIARDSIDRYIRRVYQINDASQIEDQSHSLHDFWPESESITFHSCVIYRAGKTIDCLNPDRIRVLQRDTGLENHCISDRLTLELLIDDLRVGDVVDIESTQTEFAGPHMLHGKFYLSTTRLSWGVPVKDMLCRYVNETDSSITLQHLRTDDDTNDVWELAPGDTYTHQLDNLKSEQGVNHLPHWYWPDFLLATTTCSWPDVSSYIFDQNTQSNILDLDIDPALLEDIDGIDWGQNNTTNITAVVRFVQENIRYRAESNGIHTHTPKCVSETLRRRTGDCKDKSALLVVLLNKIGIEANLALVNTAMRDDVKTIQPSAYWFNHMVVHFTYNDRSYVIDPTKQKQGGDIDSQARLDFGLCLPITQPGSELVPVAYDKNPLLYDEQVDVDLRFPELNQCTVKIERTYYQERADNMRYQIAAHEKSYFEDHFLEVAQDFVNLELSIIEPYKVESDNKQKNCLRTVELYQIQGDIESIEERMLTFDSYAHSDFIMPKRNAHPVATTETGRTRNVVNVHYGTSPATVKDNFELSSDWFAHRDSLKNQGSSIICTTDFVSHASSVAAEDVATCRAAAEKLNSRSKTRVPLMLDLEVETSVADHQWYLYPVAYLGLLQATKTAGFWSNPIAMSAIVILPIAYLAYTAHSRKWLSFAK